MAITSKDQILDSSDLSEGFRYLDKAVTQLENAVSELTAIKKYCNHEVVDIDGVITPSEKIDKSIGQINALIAEINMEKSKVQKETNKVHNQQKKEFADYKEEQKKKEEEKKKKKGDD